MTNGAHAIVFNPDRTEVLLVKRKDVPVWVFPGGQIEIKEKPKEAAVRETFEESGYKIKIIKFIGKYTKQKSGVVGFVFEGKVVGGKAQASNESSEVKFFPTTQIPELVAPTVPAWLGDALKNLNKPVNGVFPVVGKKILLTNLFLHPTLVFRYLSVAWFGIHLN